MGYVTFPSSPFTAGMSWFLAYVTVWAAIAHFYFAFINPRTRTWSFFHLVFFIVLATFGILLGHNVLASII